MSAVIDTIKNSVHVRGLGESSPFGAPSRSLSGAQINLGLPVGFVVRTFSYHVVFENGETAFGLQLFAKGDGAYVWSTYGDDEVEHATSVSYLGHPLDLFRLRGRPDHQLLAIHQTEGYDAVTSDFFGVDEYTGIHDQFFIDTSDGYTLHPKSGGWRLRSEQATFEAEDLLFQVARKPFRPPWVGTKGRHGEFFAMPLETNPDVDVPKDGSGPRNDVARAVIFASDQVHAAILSVPRAGVREIPDEQLDLLIGQLSVEWR